MVWKVNVAREEIDLHADICNLGQVRFPGIPAPSSVSVPPA